MTKSCFKCGVEKDINDFYKHPKMPDGHVNKCKECNKKDVSENYIKNLTHYIEYERLRFKKPERKEQVHKYQRNRRANNPIKYTAWSSVSNAIRDGRLIPEPCIICGVKAEAHHDDYTKPLDVTWLCRFHHLEHHNKVSHRSPF